jgi:hypothetical protein
VLPSLLMRRIGVLPEATTPSMVRSRRPALIGGTNCRSSKEEKVMAKQLPKTDASAVNVADYIVERLAAELTIALALPAITCFQFAMRSTAAPR